jgi:hypothetical protein
MHAITSHVDRVLSDGNEDDVKKCHTMIKLAQADMEDFPDAFTEKECVALYSTGLDIGLHIQNEEIFCSYVYEICKLRYGSCVNDSLMDTILEGCIKLNLRYCNLWMSGHADILAQTFSHTHLSLFMVSCFQFYGDGNL